MGPSIRTIALGIDNAYLIHDRSVVLIDAGQSGRPSAFLKGLRSAGVEPRDIRLIVLTHAHWDHIGLAAEIKEITGAKIVLHGNEKAWLEQATKFMPPGATRWGTVFARLLERLMLPFVRIRSTQVDIVLDDSGLSLRDYGIAGEIIHTPGHSPGSVSVVLDSGDAFVGDLAMSGLPLRLSPGLPIFAEDRSEVIRSWQKLLARNIKTVYPAHGKPFSADAMRAALSNPW